MHPFPPTPPLLRSIFVSPSSTVLVHHVTAEWETMRRRETLLSRRMNECNELKIRATSAPMPEAGGEA